MNEIIAGLEAHDKLAGWAQFFGAIIALGVTYFTAFAPHWRRKRQLRDASQRLLAHGHEALESFYRTSAYFLPQAINLKAATLAIRSVINEMNKFPIYEIDDQGKHSTARRLVAVGFALEGTCLFLDDIATRLGSDEMSEDDRNFMRGWIGERLGAVTALINGSPQERPDPSDFINSQFNY